MARTTTTGVLHVVVTLSDVDYLHGDVILGPVAAHTDVCEVAREAVTDIPTVDVGDDWDALIDAISSGLEPSDVDWDTSLDPESSCRAGCLAHRWYELRDFDGTVLATWWPEDRCGPVPTWDVYGAELRQGLPGNGDSVGLLVSPALLERSRR